MLGVRGFQLLYEDSNWADKSPIADATSLANVIVSVDEEVFDDHSAEESSAAENDPRDLSGGEEDWTQAERIVFEVDPDDEDGPLTTRTSAARTRQQASAVAQDTYIGQLCPIPREVLKSEAIKRKKLHAVVRCFHGVNHHAHFCWRRFQKNCRVFLCGAYQAFVAS